MTRRAQGRPAGARSLRPARWRLSARLGVLLVGGPAAGAGAALAAATLPNLARWVTLLLAVLVGGAVSAGLYALLLRDARQLTQAVADGLLALRERDYGVRLLTRRADELGTLADRFNELSELLRAEHNDWYQREVLLETVLESAPLALVLTDEAGTVVLGNTAARDLLHEGHALVGARWADLLERLDAEARAALGADEDAFFTVEQAGRSETYHAAKRYFDISTQRHVLYLVRPMSREMMRQEVEVWKKVIRLVNHEVGNSLAPISSMVHSARTALGRPEHTATLEKIFATIEERTRHLKGFLDGYARFARLSRPRKEAVAWGPFLEELQALYPFRLGAPAPASPGHFDAAQLQQALINLLKNAVESGSALDEIVVTVTSQDRGGFAVEVADRGQGMSDEALERALLPFYSTKKQGQGLGLALCREIAEAHGGELSLTRRPDGGMAVRLTLPG